MTNGSRGRTDMLRQPRSAATLVPANGVELEVIIEGTGEPVLLIQTALLAEGFAPLIREPALRDRYQLIRYHRRGYAGSSPVHGPGSIEQDAADCRALMTALRTGPAHMVGLSYSGAIALRLAVDAADLVHSLTLLEPPPMHTPSEPQFRPAPPWSTTTACAAQPSTFPLVLPFAGNERRPSQRFPLRRGLPSLVGVIVPPAREIEWRGHRGRQGVGTLGVHRRVTVEVPGTSLPGVVTGRDQRSARHAGFAAAHLAHDDEIGFSGRRRGRSQQVAAVVGKTACTLAGGASEA